MSNWNWQAVGHWRELPYPGERPECSWRLVDDVVHRVIPVGDGWSDAVTGEDIDLSGRIFILAYGSNANPSKLLGIDAVMLQAEITDAQAVWSRGRRRKDGSVVSTIVEVPGNIEACPVLAVTPADLLTVDDWEMPAYYRKDFWGRCTLENGSTAMPKVYVGGPDRMPLLMKGDYIRLHHFDHGYVDQQVPK